MPMNRCWRRPTRSLALSPCLSQPSDCSALNVVQRLTPDARNRHPHGHGRPARGLFWARVLRESMLLVAAGIAIGIAVAIGRRHTRRITTVRP